MMEQFKQYTDYVRKVARDLVENNPEVDEDILIDALEEHVQESGKWGEYAYRLREDCLDAIEEVI